MHFRVLALKLRFSMLDVNCVLSVAVYCVLHGSQKNVTPEEEFMVAAVDQSGVHGTDPTQRLRLLLVDDDPDIVRGTQLRLAAEGYEVMKAFDGGQCFDLAVNDRPDAILLDVRMPGQDGLKTLTLLQRNQSTSEIPVIMLSGSIADEEPALDRGARFFLRKPCSRDSLLTAIESVTRRRITDEHE